MGFNLPNQSDAVRAVLARNRNALVHVIDSHVKTIHPPFKQLRICLFDGEDHELVKQVHAPLDELEIRYSLLLASKDTTDLELLKPHRYDFTLIDGYTSNRILSDDIRGSVRFLLDMLLVSDRTVLNFYNPTLISLFAEFYQTNGFSVTKQENRLKISSDHSVSLDLFFPTLFYIAKVVELVQKELDDLKQRTTKIISGNGLVTLSFPGLRSKFEFGER